MSTLSRVRRCSNTGSPRRLHNASGSDMALCLSSCSKEGEIRVTNKSNLPAIVEDWAKHDPYDRGTADYTTTELIKPVRILGLERKYWDKMEIDIQDLLWRMDGQAKHVIFQKLAETFPDRYIAEKRYTFGAGGFTISGQLDLYDVDTKTLHDFKWTSTWKKVFGEDEDWTQQANINAFLIYQVANLHCEKLSNIVIFRDWSQRLAQRDPQHYPQTKCVEWPLEKWDLNKTLQFIQNRAGSHKAAAENGDLPLCTPEERWQKPARWAVMKGAQKRAVKLFDSSWDAGQWVMQQTDANALRVEERKGEDTRCLFYCDVAAYCDHGREVLAEAQKL